MTKESIETRVTQLEALSPGNWELVSADIHEDQKATAMELLWLNNAKSLYLTLAEEALSLYDKIETMEWRTSKVDFTVVDVKATLDLPDEADVLRRARRDIILEKVTVELQKVEAAFPSTLSREQYDRRKAVLAELKSQIQTIYEANLPNITWSKL